MEDKHLNQRVMLRDTMIYMIAKFIEALVGVLMMSSMTFIFTAKQIGVYSVFNIAITTIGMMIIQWLAQSTLRFVNKYCIQQKKLEFFSTVFRSWLKLNIIISVVMTIILLIILFFADIIIPNQVIKFVWLIIIGTLWLITYNASQLITSIVSALRESRLNLLLSIISVVGKLFLLVLFTRLWGSKVEFIFLSYFLTDLIVTLIGFMKLRLYKYIYKNNSSKEILLELKSYGTPLMCNMLISSILNKSDIYIITFFISASAAGIYQTSYSLVSTTFTMLSTAVMRRSYPTVLRSWSEGKKEYAMQLVSNSARMYLMIAIPAVVGIAILSDVIVKTLYSAEYFEGHIIMFWCALGMLFSGLNEYNIKPWELNVKSKSILKRSLISGISNVLLNLLLVPFLGYKVAGITTFIAFLIYFILTKIGTRKYLQWSLPLKVYIRIFLSSIGMAVILYFIKNIFSINIITLIVMVIIGIIVYFILMFVTGEIKEEVKKLIKFIGVKRSIKQ